MAAGQHMLIEQETVDPIAASIRAAVADDLDVRTAALRDGLVDTITALVWKAYVDGMREGFRQGLAQGGV